MHWREHDREHPHDLGWGRNRPIVVSAGFPDEDEPVASRQLLEIEEALLSLARAAFAAGRRLVVPADEVVMPLLAQVTGEYADDVRAESADRPTPLLDVVGDVRTVDRRGLDHVRFQDAEPAWRLSPDVLVDLAPVAAVVIGGARESPEDVEILRSIHVPVYVVETTLTGSGRGRDARLGEALVWPALRDLEWGFAGGDDGVIDAEQAIPYGYVLQQFIEALTD